MRILWFTNTPSKYDQGKHSYHGGGWIESLEELVSRQNNIELAISFFHKQGFEKDKKENTTYYPILRKSQMKTPIKSIINGLLGRIEPEYKIVPKLLKVIDDFKPDIIQIFGTEEVFASIQKYTDIPVVIHLQGLIIPYLNTYFPPNQSYLNFIFSRFFLLKNLVGRGEMSSYLQFKKQAEREKSHLSNSKYIMGRTDWDYNISKLYSPNSQYFQIEEVLRDVFYGLDIKKYEEKSTITIVSTLSETVYKGIDVVLKTAKVLKEQTKINFRWQIIGIDEESTLFKHFVSSVGINAKDVEVVFLGKKKPRELILLLKNADLFIHPSYIDNSPNSVCEAQIIGIPVIACNVGGLSTIIKDGKTGVLVPSNGVFEIVSVILDYIEKPEKYFTIGKNARDFAIKRHNKNTILSNLLSSYSDIINDK